MWNHDQFIHHNLIVFNRDAQVWGWFDVKDSRHWPAVRTGGEPGGSARPSERAHTTDAPPAKTANVPRDGLTLQQLRLRFVNNVYFAAPGQGWFKWRPTWALHESYAGLLEFQSALGIDTDGQVLDPGFADLLQRDFRLRAESRERLQEHIPRGPVPGAQIGD